MTATSGVSAATAVSRSPVNGQVIGRTGPAVSPQHREREPGGAGRVPVRHAGVAVLLQLQRPWPGVLHRVTEAVQRADTRIAAPGEDQPARAAGADDLVVDHVRGHPDQRQVTALLPDQFMPGRERNEVGEALHGHGVAVMDGRGDGFGKRHDLRHALVSPEPMKVTNRNDHHEPLTAICTSVRDTDILASTDGRR